MTTLDETLEVQNSISETAYLLTISGMKESIIEGLEESLDGCSSDLFQF
ncbi:MAG: hypothetical protein KAJ19_20770 [Gammaproteobacteria bacterium]|nr:hypothetical protein [Gammaproteobacteria bacterium]